MIRKALLGCVAVAAVSLALPVQAATNLVLNGDFELGNTAFSSDYAYSVDTTPPAVYDVDDDPNDGHPAFTSFGDHTSGAGKMMIVNGSEVPGQRVWYQNNVSVTANTTYFFWAWIASAHPTSPAQLKFSINGTEIGSTFMAPATTGNWQKFYTPWNSGANTTADIALVNQNTDFSGNDFALDDLGLSTSVPEPATWAMMIIGFGGVGSVLRRQRRSHLLQVA
ncbi:MAG: PEPxxWA-CTERM sorting domain-containing protein [Patescibacteria group bacterium]